MKWIFKALLVGMLVGGISMTIGFYIGNSIDTSHLYKQNIQK